MRRFIIAIVMAVLITCGSVSIGGASGGSELDIHLTPDEEALINFVNEARRAHGLGPLAVDTMLVHLARKKSKDMIDNDYFAHDSPTYGSPFDMMRSAGVAYSRAAENISTTVDPAVAHDAFMNSSGHRANILSPGFTHIGIGMVRENGAQRTTQLFATLQ